MLRLHLATSSQRIVVTVAALVTVTIANTCQAQQPASATFARLVWQIESPPFSHRGGVGDVAFSPDGRFLVTFAASPRNQQTYFLWEAATGKLLRRLEPKEISRGGAGSVAYSPDGKLILGGWGLGYVTVWEAATGRELFTKKVHNETVLNAKFMPDSAHMVSCGSDRTIIVTRVADQAVAASWTFSRPSAAGDSMGLFGASDSPAAASVDVASDGRRVVTAHWKSNSSEAAVWQIGTDTPVVRIEQPNQGTTASGRVFESAVFTKDGAHIISAGARIVPRSSTKLTHGPVNIQVVELRKWDAKTGQLVAEYSAPDVHGFGRIEISPDGQTLATNDFGGIHLWRLGENQPFRYIETPERGSLSRNARFSSDSQRIATGAGNAISIWNVQTGTVVAGGDPSITRITSVAWNANASKFALGRHNAVETWDLSTRRRRFAATMGRPLGPTSSLHDVTGLGFSTDGTQLIAGGTRDDEKTYQAGIVRTWAIASGELQNEASFGIESQGEVDGLILSPDRKQAVIVFQGQAPALFNLSDQKKVAELSGIRSSRDLIVAQFSLDGRFVHVVNRQGEASRWDPAVNQETFYTTEWRTAAERSGRQQPPWVEHAAFSPDGRVLVTSHRANSQSGTPSALVNWDNEISLPIRVVRDVPPCLLVISPDSRLLAGFEIETNVSGQKPTDTIHIWDLNTGQELFTLQPQDARATAIAFSPDSKQLLTGFDRGTFAIWDVR